MVRTCCQASNNARWCINNNISIMDATMETDNNHVLICLVKGHRWEGARWSEQHYCRTCSEAVTCKGRSCEYCVESSRCRCDEDEIESHTCPFASEINNDDSLCNCCVVCEQNCADDI